MSSGHKRIQFNTRERAVSDDLNRLQSFVAAQRAGALRRLVNDRYVTDVSNGLAIESQPDDTPVSGDVFGGLMVQPVVGTSSLTVSPGVVGLFSPDPVPNPDDGSGYKVVESLGVSTMGTLTIAPGGVGIRIDVIECRPVELGEENDNRDIFKPSTGKFEPSSVDKVVATRLEFRVRAGTPGGGFPGTVEGWLPLAVASVPAGATSTDAVTFWDVRPLVQDRAEAPHKSGRMVHTHTSHVLTADEYVEPGKLTVVGTCEGKMGSHKTGGTLFKGTPTATMGTGDVAGIDVLNQENWEPGLMPVVNMPWYLWSLFPFGLPRWVRYTENSIAGQGRVPGSMRGICVASMTAPIGLIGAPKNPIALPASTGLVGSTPIAWMVAAGSCDPLFPMGPQGFVADGDVFWLTKPIIVNPQWTDGRKDLYRFAGNVSHPVNVRSIIARFHRRTAVALEVSTYRTLSVCNDSTGDHRLAELYRGHGNVDAVSLGTRSDVLQCEIPLRNGFPAYGAIDQFVLLMYDKPWGTGFNSVAEIIGWRIGP